MLSLHLVIGGHGDFLTKPFGSHKPCDDGHDQPLF